MQDSFRKVVADFGLPQLLFQVGSHRCFGDLFTLEFHELPPTILLNIIPSLKYSLPTIGSHQPQNNQQSFPSRNAWSTSSHPLQQKQMQGQSFKLTVPSFSKIEDTVYYNFLVDDFLHSKKWHSDFTYKQLEQFYETLIDNGLKKHLIEFPATPFWKFWVKVDNSDKLIEERRESLEEFFQHILQNPYTKKHKLVVNFIKIAHKRRDTAQQIPASPGTPVAQQYSPVFSPKQAGTGFMTPGYKPMHSPIKGQIKKAQSLYGFTFQNGTKRKQSVAAISASSMRGKNMGRKLSLNQHAS